MSNTALFKMDGLVISTTGIIFRDNTEGTWRTVSKGVTHERTGEPSGEKFPAYCLQYALENPACVLLRF